MKKNYLEVEQQYCTQGDTSGRRSPKKIFSEANGFFLYDENNIQYLDMQMFNSAANFGYQHPDFNNTLLSNIHTLPCLASEFLSHDRIMLSKRICEYMERNHGVKGRVHFSVGGAQAIDLAIKLVSNYTNNKNLFAFEGGYHGRTIAASSVSSSYRYSKMFGSVIDTYRIPFPYCYRCPYGKECESCNLFCLDRFEELFESEFYGITDTDNKNCAYSAFLAEPMLGRGGYIPAPKKYFARLSAILKKHNILFIADEIQMGFYRTGKLWAFENYGFVPDIIVFGKSISNGLWPLSGIWAKEELISPDIWTVGSCHATFAGHPLGVSLGMTTFDIISAEKFEKNIQDNMKYFLETVHKLKDDYSIIGRADVLGFAAGIEIINPETKAPDSKLAHLISDNALNKPINIDGTLYGLILTVGGFFNNSFMISPSVLINKDTINLFDRLIRCYLDYAVSQRA